MAEDHDDPYTGEEALEDVRGDGKKKKRTPLGAVDLTLVATAASAGEDEDSEKLDAELALKALNDRGNGERLIRRHGRDLMYVKDIGWFAWNGAKWDREHGDAEAVKRAHLVSEAVVREAKALKAHDPTRWEERIDRLYAWSVSIGNMARSRAMLDAAEPYLTHSIDALDADPFLAATGNGTLKLKRDYSMRESERGDRITRATGCDFDPDATCPLFEKFIAEILPDAEMCAFVQRMAGYSLSGSTREQKFFMLYGMGRNGKSTLVNTLRKVFGDYGMSSPVSTFLAKKEGNSGADASPDLARLPGARLVTAAEPPEGARLDESTIKAMTGGDPMTVRHLNKGFFEFSPVFKAWILTNHQPTIRGTDTGIWRRVLLVPFKVQIAVEDRELEAKLARELPGILNWVLAGFEAWLERGLDPPAAAIAATESYRADQDPVGEFLKARCEVVPPDWCDPSTGKAYELGAKELRGAYKTWCEEEGLDPLPAKTFGAKLAGHGIPKRKSNGLTRYVGIQFKKPPEGVGVEDVWTGSPR